MATGHGVEDDPSGICRTSPVGFFLLTQRIEREARRMSDRSPCIPCSVGIVTSIDRDWRGRISGALRWGLFTAGQSSHKMNN